MRYRDCPTTECSTRVAAPPEAVWELVTDITLPARFSPELKAAEWLDGATGVAVGNRFRGHNCNDVMGDWSTTCLVSEVEEGRRWVWQVVYEDGEVSSSWGFEVEPGRDATTVRQWGRMGPGPSGLTPAILAMPDKEGRIIARRLAEWRAGMTANLDGLAQLLGPK
ncbi:SRPBCC family protein [Sporichthya brevicatena]|uniref:SRPBCC family protein n=1 Tax=Sporichthya brevicatena TaxID=171442 RepID=A0ABN1G5G4_9ACTN